MDEDAKQLAFMLTDVGPFMDSAKQPKRVNKIWGSCLSAGQHQALAWLGAMSYKSPSHHGLTCTLDLVPFIAREITLQFQHR